MSLDCESAPRQRTTNAGEAGPCTSASDEQYVLCIADSSNLICKLSSRFYLVSLQAQGIAKLIGIKILFTAAVSVTEIVINYLSRRCPVHQHIMTNYFCPETSEQFFFSCAITQSYCQLYLYPLTLACCQKAEPEITARFFNDGRPARYNAA